MRPAAEGYEHARKDPADAVKTIVEHKADHDAVYRRKVLDLILSKIAAPAENGPYGSAEGAQYASVQENPSSSTS